MSASILERLERFGVSSTQHSQRSLLEHLQGTHDLLVQWGAPEYLCLGGLCHSLYGTESFSKSPASLDNRDYLRELIGAEAERLAYLFGAHRKESLWKNLERQDGYAILDRFTGEPVAMSKQDLRDLLELTLANWLEQRPRAEERFKNLRREEFLRAQSYLSALAYDAFLSAYGFGE